MAERKDGRRRRGGRGRKPARDGDAIPYDHDAAQRIASDPAMDREEVAAREAGVYDDEAAPPTPVPERAPAPEPEAEQPAEQKPERPSRRRRNGGSRRRRRPEPRPVPVEAPVEEIPSEEETLAPRLRAKLEKRATT